MSAIYEEHKDEDGFRYMTYVLKERGWGLLKKERGLYYFENEDQEKKLIFFILW